VRLDAKDLEASLRSVKARYAAQEAQVIVTKARIESQRSQIVSAQATLKDAKLDLTRRGKLNIGEDITQTDIDHLQTKVDEADARLVGSRHDLTAAEQELVVLRHNLVAAEAEVAKAQEDLNYTVIPARSTAW
jgi:multidrug resistance efflux pump